MNKKVIIILAILFVIGITVGLVVGLSNRKTIWITDYDYLYDKAIEYLKDEVKQSSYYKDEEDYNVFADYKSFGIEEKGNQKIAYMYIAEEEYFVRNNKLRIGSGAAMLHKFTFENNEVIKEELPEDGTRNGQSIRALCPDSIENEVLSCFLSTDNVRAQAKEHYSYLPSNEITYYDYQEEAIIYTGYYGGYTTKKEANSVKGKIIDGYGNIYQYEIPCNENEELLYEISDINKEIIEKYKGNAIGKISEEDLKSIIDNLSTISNEYVSYGISMEDEASYFVNAVYNATINLISNTQEGVTKNSSESGKKILEVLDKNELINLN